MNKEQFEKIVNEISGLPISEPYRVSFYLPDRIVSFGLNIELYKLLLKLVKEENVQDESEEELVDWSKCTKVEITKLKR